METLYHYCSTNTFASILQNKSIWLSSLTLSNDSMEGQLVKKSILYLAEQDQLSDHHCKRLEESLAFLERTLEGLGFCLSEQGDLLSQWRGYADDAHGFSIGFSKKYLDGLSQKTLNAHPSFTLQKVQYENHQDLVRGTYLELKKLIQAGAFKTPGFYSLLSSFSTEEVLKNDEAIKSANTALMMRILGLSPQLYKLKSGAFKEESEWRLVSLIPVGLEDSFLIRTARDRAIPYRIFQLEDLDTPCINEVILGPKNKTPPEIVKAMLRRAGLESAEVKKSEATYV